MQHQSYKKRQNTTMRWFSLRGACVFDSANQRVKLSGVRQFFAIWALVLLGQVVQVLRQPQVMH